MFKKIRTDKRGFTPVELMVVILAIGILALVSVLFLNSSQAKARDAKRLIDIRRIQTGLELYQVQYGGYPQTTQSLVLGKEPFMKLCDSSSGSFVAGSTPCVNTFIEPIPSDPLVSKNYVFYGTTEGYSLQFETEKASTIGAAGAYYAHSGTIDQVASPK